MLPATREPSALMMTLPPTWAPVATVPGAAPPMLTMPVLAVQRKSPWPGALSATVLPSAVALKGTTPPGMMVIWA